MGRGPAQRPPIRLARRRWRLVLGRSGSGSGRYPSAPHAWQTPLTIVLPLRRRVCMPSVGSKAPHTSHMCTYVKSSMETTSREPGMPVRSIGRTGSALVVVIGTVTDVASGLGEPGGSESPSSGQGRMPQMRRAQKEVMGPHWGVEAGAVFRFCSCSCSGRGRRLSVSVAVAVAVAVVWIGTTTSLGSWSRRVMALQACSFVSVFCPGLFGPVQFKLKLKLKLKLVGGRWEIRGDPIGSGRNFVCGRPLFFVLFFEGIPQGLLIF